jgi:RNA polymerase sigma-70 factor (sigma-E family)
MTFEVHEELSGELRMALTFDEFVAARLPSLSRYAGVLTGDRQLAEDVVQEVLVRAYGKWPRIRSTERPEAYVKAMVTREYLSWRRRLARRAALLAGKGGPPGEPIVADHAADVARRADVAAMLERLSARQRTVLVLRYYEGLTDVEIGDMLGCSAGTVRTYHARALARLRGAMETADPAPMLGEAR